MSDDIGQSEKLLQKIISLIPLNEQAELKEKIDNLSIVNKLRQPNFTKNQQLKAKYDVSSENFCLYPENSNNNTTAIESNEVSNSKSIYNNNSSNNQNAELKTILSENISLNEECEEKSPTENMALSDNSKNNIKKEKEKENDETKFCEKKRKNPDKIKQYKLFETRKKKKFDIEINK